MSLYQYKFNRSLFRTVFFHPQTTEALLYDAVSLVAAGVEALQEKEREAAKGAKGYKGPLTLAQLDCNRSAHWEHGKALLEAIKGVKAEANIRRETKPPSPSQVVGTHLKERRRRKTGKYNGPLIEDKVHIVSVLQQRLLCPSFLP